jgi:cysteinyl-tRNA synthetase
VAPLVEAVLALRRQWREDGRFADADRLRDLLAACGVEVRDARDGSGWVLLESPGRAGAGPAGPAA